MERPSLTSYDGFDHKIGVEYDINESSMLFADWSTGYRVGSMGGSESGPETLDAYSLGVKNRFFDNKLQLNWTAYYYDYKNYPADLNISDPLTNMQDEGSQSSGDMTMYGSDLQTDIILSENDRMNVSVSYISAEFDHLFFDFDSEALTDLAYSGKPLTFTPDWTINLAYTHNFNLPNGGALSARFDTRYQTSFLINFMEEVGAMIDGVMTTVSYVGYNEQEAYHLSNLSMTYSNPDRNWTLAGYVKNLEDYAVKRNLMESSMMIGPPRTYGLVLSVKF
jgi:iron complex outermembrane receptor protein